jgi:hypothetical protein
MTIGTKDKLRCECGHEGWLNTVENEKPYTDGWLRHTLEGFTGVVSEWRLNDVLCPACGQVGKVEFVESC